MVIRLEQAIDEKGRTAWIIELRTSKVPQEIFYKIIAVTNRSMLTSISDITKELAQYNKMEQNHDGGEPVHSSIEPLETVRPDLVTGRKE